MTSPSLRRKNRDTGDQSKDDAIDGMKDQSPRTRIQISLSISRPSLDHELHCVSSLANQSVLSVPSYPQKLTPDPSSQDSLPIRLPSGSPITRISPSTSVPAIHALHVIHDALIDPTQRSMVLLSILVDGKESRELFKGKECLDHFVFASSPG